MPVETRIRPAFAEAVKAALGDLTFNQAAYKTGLSDEYIRKMAGGRVPSEHVISRFAAGLGADLEKLRIAAGYAQPTDVVEAVDCALGGVDLPEWAKEELRGAAEKLRDLCDANHNVRVKVTVIPLRENQHNNR